MEYANDKYFLARLQREVQWARSKHPTNYNLFAALVEEVGEVAKALQDGDEENLITELLQVACVALRLTTEGDPSHPTSRQAALLFSKQNISDLAKKELQDE